MRSIFTSTLLALSLAAPAAFANGGTQNQTAFSGSQTGVSPSQNAASGSETAFSPQQSGTSGGQTAASGHQTAFSPQQNGVSGQQTAISGQQTGISEHASQAPAWEQTNGKLHSGDFGQVEHRGIFGEPQPSGSVHAVNSAAELRKFVGQEVYGADGDALGTLARVENGASGKMELVVQHGGVVGANKIQTPVAASKAKPVVKGGKLVVSMTLRDLDQFSQNAQR